MNTTMKTPGLTDEILELWAQVFRVGKVDYVQFVRRFPNGPVAGRRPRTETQDWQQRAWYWLWDDEHAPGSFTWLCELFGFDVVATREHIHREAKGEA